MLPRLSVALLAFSLVAAAPACDSSTPNTGSSRNVELVGHDPLFNRGMNAAPSMFGDFLYIGDRTDGSSQCGDNDPRYDAMDPFNACPHPHNGVLIVDVKDPAHPRVAGQIGPPNAGLVGITTRELRVWPAKNLLIVMSFRCNPALHACPAATDQDFGYNIKFFDLSDPLHPKFLLSYVPTSAAGKTIKPHEMFLWVDPGNADRALLFVSTPSLLVDPAVPNLMVVDISAVPAMGPARLVAEGNWNMLYPGAEVMNSYDADLTLHSVNVSVDGARSYLSMNAGHFLVIDTSSVAAAGPAVAGAPPPASISLNDKILTQPVDRPYWGPASTASTLPPPPCEGACPASHSSIKVPGRPFVVNTDEAYGKANDPSQGCPWAWMHLLDIRDEAHPRIAGTYKLPQNEDSFCGSAGDDPETEQYASFSSHNLTVLPHLVVVTWHAGGLQFVDITDPASPRQAGYFLPEPLTSVANEDPRLGGGRGPNKVIMWSYPIIKNGLIYVMDVRNGLYVLRYRGPGADEIASVKFLEGNSNLGDAVALAK